MLRKKAQRTVNPFDIIDEESNMFRNDSEETVRAPLTVINPLPFNPYVLDSPTPVPNRQPNVQAPSSQNQPPPPVFTAPPVSSYPRHEAIPNSFQPPPFNNPSNSPLDENEEPPLLEDIGIDPGRIKDRIVSIVKFSDPPEDMLHDPDLSGPIIIALCFGFLLMLSGKLHFGDIYAMFIVGNLLLYFLFNLMSQAEIIPLYNIMSAIGYAMLPMLVLGLLGIFLSLKGGLGVIIALSIAFWSSLSASKMVTMFLRDSEKKGVVGYPLFLFYVSFATIVIL